MRKERIGFGRIGRNLLILFGVFAAAVSVSFIYRCVTRPETEAYGAPIFVLAVLLVSRFTEGYLYGLIASILGVICVNFFFTYPYMAVNFSLAGYPLAFLTLLGVSLMTGTLTSRAKQRDQLAIENERERIRNDLLRSISHDIRTPLTSIIGSTAALLDSPTLDREEERTLLTDVQDEAKWLLHMTENLLVVTKMDQAQELRFEPWAVEEVIGETVQKLQKTYPDVQTEVSVPDTLLFVPMDPTLIGQVLFNLAENGILHGGRTTTLWIRAYREADMAVISVEDNGNGFPEDLLKAFAGGELPEGITSDQGGKRNMGLGLRVCSAIVRAHSGSLLLKNTDAGAAAEVRLPADKEYGLEDHYDDQRPDTDH